MPPKSSGAIEGGSAGLFDLEGMSENQRRVVAQRRGEQHVNRNFSQTITVRCDDPAPIVEMLAEWDLDQATSDIMGYMGTRVLADRENPGQYVIIADFGVVDPDVSAADEAARNNDARPRPRRSRRACSK